MNDIKISKAQIILNELHFDAQKDYLRIGKGIVKSIFRPMQPADFENAYLPISKKQGLHLKRLVIDNICRNVIEFGTSFGISTLYLLEGVKHTDGKVISTELLDSKAKRALQNIKSAGLEEYVEIKVGDALQTLKNHSDPIDFFFLDGWKDLYLPLFKMLEPYFHSRTLIYADNLDMNGTRNYADYILSNTKKFDNSVIEGGKAYLTRFR